MDYAWQQDYSKGAPIKQAEEDGCFEQAQGDQGSLSCQTSSIFTVTEYNYDTLAQTAARAGLPEQGTRDSSDG